MKLPFKSFFRDRSGASAVEFALVAAPLITLLFGTVEFARLYWTEHALTRVATAAARCVAIPEDGCSGSGGMLDAAKAKRFVADEGNALGLALADKDISIDTAATCSGLTGFVRVSLGYSFQSPLSGVVSQDAQGMPLQASACFSNG